MTDFDRIKEMMRNDSFLYRTICDVVDSSVSTEKVYEIWKKLSEQPHWSIKDIEECIQ